MVVEYEFETGQLVKDKISGCEGIIDACAYWINGCKRYSVQPQSKDDGSGRPESWWIDEESILLIDDGISDTYQPPSITGGPSSRSSNARY